MVYEERHGKKPVFGILGENSYDLKGIGKFSITDSSDLSAFTAPPQTAEDITSLFPKLGLVKWDIRKPDLMERLFYGADRVLERTVNDAYAVQVFEKSATTETSLTLFERFKMLFSNREVVQGAVVVTDKNQNRVVLSGEEHPAIKDAVCKNAYAQFRLCSAMAKY